MLKNCRIFTTEFIQGHIMDVVVTMTRMYQLFAALFSVFFIFTYLATFMYRTVCSGGVFANIGISFFTMLQIMTMDGW